MATLPHPTAPRRWILPVSLFATFVVALLALGAPGRTPGTSSAVLLALPALLAGTLSFVSPCCLPVITAYVAYAARMDRARLPIMTVLFFLGLATTIVVLGATTTALSRLLFAALPTLTTIGGIAIIGFGIASVLGKGFAGPQLGRVQNATLFGAYLYGATFALGWSACVGPILGALLTMLATQGIAVVQGAALALIYALGLGLPLFLLALSIERLDRSGRGWQLLRGRGVHLSLGRVTLDLHSTSIVSGTLLIFIGVLLATGQLAVISRWGINTTLAQWVLGVEESIRRVFVGG